MASICISECIDNACIVPAGRPSYVNLQQLPEEENGSAVPHRPRLRAADGISRRQMYLRSYTFSTDDTVVHESTSQNCLGKLKRKRRPAEIRGVRRRSRCFAIVRAAAKKASSSALLSMFRRVLCCVAKVDGRKHL